MMIKLERAGHELTDCVMLVQVNVPNSIQHEWMLSNGAPVHNTKVTSIQ